MAIDPEKKKVAVKKVKAGPNYTELNPKTSNEQNRYRAQNNLNEALKFRSSLAVGEKATKPVHDPKSGSQSNNRSVTKAEIQKADSVINASRVYLKPKKVAPKK